MPNPTDTTETHEVEMPAIVKGDVRFLSKAAFANPAPDRLKKFLTGGRYFAVGAISIVSASDLFSGGQAKIINFSLAVFILLLGAIEASIGVESKGDTAKRKNGDVSKKI